MLWGGEFNAWGTSSLLFYHPLGDGLSPQKGGISPRNRGGNHPGFFSGGRRGAWVLWAVLLGFVLLVLCVLCCVLPCPPSGLLFRAPPPLFLLFFAPLVSPAFRGFRPWAPCGWPSFFLCRLFRAAVCPAFPPVFVSVPPPPLFSALVCVPAPGARGFGAVVGCFLACPPPPWFLFAPSGCDLRSGIPAVAV